MWYVLLNCLIVAVVISVGAFASLYVEIMIRNEDMAKFQSQNQPPF